MLAAIKIFFQCTIIIPPANCVCGRVYCFHVVRPSVCPSVRPLRFVFLITLRVMNGISSNLAYTFISTGQILILKKLGLRAISMRVISLCNSQRLFYIHKQSFLHNLKSH